MFSFIKNVWNSGWGNKVFLVACGLIFVAAVAGVIYGVAVQG